MKILQTLLLFLIPIFFWGQGQWVQKSGLPALSRGRAIAFSIGTKGYLGTGSINSGFNTDDFWEYDPAADAWTQKASFGGGNRGFAAAFVIGNFGYAGSGMNDAGGATQDFWKYDPGANVWTLIASLPSIVTSAFGFGVAGKGYVGTGGASLYSASYNTLWEYDPAFNTWTTKAPYPPGNRIDIDRAVFTIGNKAYLGAGQDGFSVIYADFWEYDPALNLWTEKANIPGPNRYGATGFSICGKGFIGLGCGGGYALYDYWMYDPPTDTWSAVPFFPGLPRWDLPTFVIDDKAYLGTGEFVYLGSPAPSSDFWEFSIPIAPAVTSVKDTICSGSPVVLNASGGSNYLWNNGDTTSSVTVSPDSTTTYSVAVSVYGCSQSVSKTVPVIFSASSGFSYSYDPCHGGCVHFLDQSTHAFTMEWNFGDGSVSKEYNPCHAYSDSSTYLVTQRINDSTNCASSMSISFPYATHQITDYVFIPNTFSPNGDGNNDVLKFYRQDNYCLKEFSIKIFDRWGELVFQTSNITDSWDGVYKGQKLDTNVFTYYCTIAAENGSHSTLKGNISLVR
jgi:gliding motility-associated-like protein